MTVFDDIDFESHRFGGLLPSEIIFNRSSPSFISQGANANEICVVQKGYDDRNKWLIVGSLVLEKCK